MFIQMKRIHQRNVKLTSEELDDFINDHLPYRVRILKSLIEYPRMTNEDKYWPSIYESAQITCRMFIQFLGLGVMWKDGQVILKSETDYVSFDGYTSHEVKIVDLGFDFVNLEELPPTEQHILAHAYEAGSKATAHLNWNKQFVSEPRKVIQAAIIIKRILCNRIPLLG
jgi:hypothetical protein